MRDKKSQKPISKNQSTPEKIKKKIKTNKQQKENTPMRKELSSKL